MGILIKLMTYKSITKAKFISRPNRFIARVEVDGIELVVHVKNTGRCKELLIPGCAVYLEKADNLERKTPYDLVAVEKDGTIINIDSQAPNKVVKEWLLSQGQYDKVQPEYKYGNSRIDFYMEKAKAQYLMEVKGCTLFILVIKGMTVEKFKDYFKKQVIHARKEYSTDMIFGFAWNEWAEGAYMEPDEANGYGVLEAIRDTLIELNEWPDADI